MTAKNSETPGLWDIQGKVCLVTGATSGIGRAAALELARRGARLLLVGRDPVRGQATLDEIRSQVPGAQLEFLSCDLSSVADIRRLAGVVMARPEPLHVLFNNAGGMNLRRQLTSDGYELTFALNHLAYFCLTDLLLPKLKESAPARIVSTSSDAHEHAKGGLDFANLQGEKSYNIVKSYGASKLANILFTRELSRRLEGTDVTANCFHPGLVSTRFAQNNGFLARLIVPLIFGFGRTPAKGAETGVYLCASPEVSTISGKYFFDMRAISPRPFAEDDAAARQLWEKSVELLARV